MEPRREMAQKIARNPQDYKICEGCDSIVVFSTLMCPNCHGYRYNVSHEEVILQAEVLGSKAQTSVTTEDLSN